MNNLTCNCVPRLQGVSGAELGRLFPESSSTAALLSLLQESGIDDGFKLRSIVVSKNDSFSYCLYLKAVLICPLLRKDGSRDR